jgi:predicted lipoprotein with Yx(FWY)xxD motif
MGMMRTLNRMCVVAIALALASTACGSSSKKAASSATSAPTTPSSTSASSNLGAELASIGAAAPSSFTVSLAKGPQGIFEVGPNGHTLYFRTTDQGTTSSCTGGCATIWRALTANGPVTAGTAVNKARLGTANGQAPNQVTYYGHLLYYYSGDSAPGQTNGVGIPTWFLLGPVGNQMQPG